MAKSWAMAPPMEAPTTCAAGIPSAWSRPAADVYHLIRGTDPSPGAGTTFEGTKIQLFRASRRDGDTGRSPGEVTEVTDDGLAVAAEGGSIFVGRVQAEGSRKIMAPEWIESVNLKQGARFGD